MIGGAQRFAVAVAVMSLGTVGTEAAAQAEAAAKMRAPWSLVASGARYVLTHEGGSRELLSVEAPRAQVWNGRRNCSAHGYAIVSEKNGAFFMVRYVAIGAHATRYTVRHVRGDGRLDWEWQIEIPTAGSTVRHIALMERPRAPVRVTR